MQLGEINLGKWQRVARVAQPHVYSWVMNDYWLTNFRLAQEGDFRWSYFLTSTRGPGNAAATRLAIRWGARPPGGRCVDDVVGDGDIWETYPWYGPVRKFPPPFASFGPR